MNVRFFINDAKKSLEVYFKNEDFKGYLVLDNPPLTQNITLSEWNAECISILNRKLRHLNSELRLKINHEHDNFLSNISLYVSNTLYKQARLCIDYELKIKDARELWENLCDWGFYEGR